MPAYFASDVHLRFDHPERSRRFGRWVDGLDGGDSLVIVGDLCDFWLASRQSHRRDLSCEGLRSLVSFRDRGGSLTLIAGNHDAWLGPFYRDRLGIDMIPDALDLELHGLRIHAVHGHHAEARSAPWKGMMEGKTFLRAFGMVPRPAASLLKSLLDRSNDREGEATLRRQMLGYRRYARGRAGSADLVVFGHIHWVVDEPEPGPRIVVLGDWYEGLSFLRVDESGASLVVRDGD